MARVHAHKLYFRDERKRKKEKEKNKRKQQIQ